MLKDIKCINCKSDSNLVIFIDFEAKQGKYALCIKNKVKPSLKRKFGTRTGCGARFSIAIKQNKTPIELESFLRLINEI